MIVLIVGLLAVVACAGFGMIAVGVASNTDPEPFVVRGTASSAPYAQPKASAKLVVEITGTGPATISYQLNGTGGQETSATLPWKKEFGPFGDSIAIWSFVAQTKSGSASAAIRISMSYGAKVFDPCEAKGAYSVTNCSGSTQ